MAELLAVDMGLRTGLALYGDDGRLRWYRSQNFGKPERLKRGIYTLLGQLPELAWLVVEGGGPLADSWLRESRRRGIQTLHIDAQTWRSAFFHDRQQRSGLTAKENADSLARKVISWSHAKRPTSLRHDAAEAILVGFWGVLNIGWLEKLPPLDKL